MTTLLRDFENSVKRFGDRFAVGYFGWRVSYKNLDRLSNSVANQLAEEVKRGDVVLLATQNIPQFPIVELAAWKLGCVVLPANPSYTRRELGYGLKDSHAKAIVAQCDCAETVKDIARELRVKVLLTNPFTFAEVPERYATKWGFTDGEEELDLSGSSSSSTNEPSPGDAALLVYTSGTTGNPKGGVLRHRNVHAGARVYRRWFRYTCKDNVLGFAPFFHVTGIVFHLAATFLSGATVTAEGRFDPVLALETVEKERTTITMMAATAYLAMLNVDRVAEYNLSSMRMWSSGGMPVPRRLEEDWKRLTGQWIYVAWGMTETSSPATLWPYPYDGVLPLDTETGVVSSGRPVYDTEVRVLSEQGSVLPEGELGELCVKGPQVIDMYLNRPDATAEAIVDSWLHSGDLAKVKDGWVYIVDRKKDMINASGFKVWPREVEEVLYMHPSVAEAAVVGVPDSYRGERVKAFVSLKPGFHPSKDLMNDIISACRKQLAPYKIPRELEFVDQLPKTLSGKLLRRVLRETAKSGISF